MQVKDDANQKSRKAPLVSLSFVRRFDVYFVRGFGDTAEIGVIFLIWLLTRERLDPRETTAKVGIFRKLWRQKQLQNAARERINEWNAAR